MTRRYVSVLFLLCAVFMPILQGHEPTQSTAPTGVVIEGTIVDAAKGVIPGVTVTLAQDKTVLARVITNSTGTFQFLNVTKGNYTITASLAGFKTTVTTLTVTVDAGLIRVPVTLEVGALTEEVTVRASTEVVRTTSATVSGLPQSSINISIDGVTTRNTLNQVTFLPGVAGSDQFYAVVTPRADAITEVPLNEGYAHVAANPFRLTAGDPLSTFGADVDTASYTNVRRFLSQGQLPPRDAVRVEEFVNYFQFDYAEPRGGASDRA